MGPTIAWAGALLSQQTHSLPNSALYSSLQNILAHKGWVLKSFMKKKTNILKKGKI
jgi:hypothetical protein